MVSPNMDPSPRRAKPSNLTIPCHKCNKPVTYDPSDITGLCQPCYTQETMHNPAARFKHKATTSDDLERAKKRALTTSMQDNVERSFGGNTNQPSASYQNGSSMDTVDASTKQSNFTGAPARKRYHGPFELDDDD